MGREKNKLMDYESNSKGYSENLRSNGGQCLKCEDGTLTHHKDETPGFKESWTSCSTSGCNPNT